MPRRPAPAAALKKTDYELLARLRYTLRKFLGFSEAAATSHGVTAQQHQALLAIEGFPGRSSVTIGELAGQLNVAHHSAVGLVDRMELLGLLRRDPSKEDRRRVDVSLTAKGRRLLTRLSEVHRAELEVVGPQLIALLGRLPGSGMESTDARRTFASPACSLPEIED